MKAPTSKPGTDPLEKLKQRLQQEAKRVMARSLQSAGHGRGNVPVGARFGDVGSAGACRKGFSTSPDHAAFIRRNLEAERRRARSGAASYDFNRHLALLRLIRDIENGKSQNTGRTPVPD